MSLRDALALMSVLTSGSVAAQEVRHVPDAPTCRDCEVALSILTRLGATDGPGMIDWRGGLTIATVDSRGRIYLMGFFATALKVYDASGRYETTIGRKGDGPGEFRGIMGSVVGPADSLFVFDRLAMRMSVFGPDHAFGRSSPIDVEPAGYQPLIASWDPEHFYITADMRTAELIGWPVHRVNRMGSRVCSFGSTTGDYSPSDSRGGTRILADTGESGTLWSGVREEYVIERVSPCGRGALEIIRRDADWFPSPEYVDTDHGERKPPPLVANLLQDHDRLWVLAWVPDPKWKEAGAGPEDKYRRYDSVIEVIDLREGRVIARSRFDELYQQFLGPGIVGGTVFEGGLVPVYHVMRAEIVRP